MPTPTPSSSSAGRTPVIYWGGNSLYSDDPARSAWDNFFQPPGDIAIAKLQKSGHSYFPPKWHRDNLLEPPVCSIIPPARNSVVLITT